MEVIKVELCVEDLEEVEPEVVGGRETILVAEDDELVRQTADSWPNRLRSARLVPAVEYVQAQRHRTRLMRWMAARFDDIHAWITPGISGEVLTATEGDGAGFLGLRVQDDPAVFEE